jgi:hypothetical protein
MENTGPQQLPDRRLDFTRAVIAGKEATDRRISATRLTTDRILEAICPGRPPSKAVQPQQVEALGLSQSREDLVPPPHHRACIAGNGTLLREVVVLGASALSYRSIRNSCESSTFVQELEIDQQVQRRMPIHRFIDALMSISSWLR